METSQQIPEQDAREHIANCRDKPFLEERYIDAFKGRRNIFGATLSYYSGVFCCVFDDRLVM